MGTRPRCGCTRATVGGEGGPSCGSSSFAQRARAGLGERYRSSSPLGVSTGNILTPRGETALASPVTLYRTPFVERWLGTIGNGDPYPQVAATSSAQASGHIERPLHCVNAGAHLLIWHALHFSVGSGGFAHSEN
jgi:hypothetical protein